MKKSGIMFVIIVLIVNVYGVLNAVEKSEKPAKYHGKKGDFIFDDADIKNVLLFFAKTYTFNIIIDPEISGKVNVRLIDVPWDQALDLILRTHGLAFIVEWSDDEQEGKEKKKDKKIKSIRIKKLPKS